MQFMNNWTSYGGSTTTAAKDSKTRSTPSQEKNDKNNNKQHNDDDTGKNGVNVTTTLAGPAMSVATFAALNSLNSYVGGSAAMDVCSAAAARGGGFLSSTAVASTSGGGGATTAGVALAAAAAAAAGEGVKYYNDRMLAQKALDQNTAIHRQETHVAAEFQAQSLRQDTLLHKLSIQHESKLHHQDLQREAEQHLQDMTNQLREGQKEADRDLWEQQNTEKQSAMTVSALLLGCGFVLAVEGTLPAIGKTQPSMTLWLFPRLGLVDVYYFCVAMAVALLLISVMAGMDVVKRMARFMLSRTAKQQETLRELRELANKQLRELQVSDDEFWKSNNNPESASSSASASKIKLGSEVRVHRKGAPSGVGVIRYMKQVNAHDGGGTRTNNYNRRGSRYRRRGKTDPPVLANAGAGTVAGADYAGAKTTPATTMIFDVEYPDGRYEDDISIDNIEVISIQERLQKARHQFSEHLWEQPVLVMDWRPIGSGRHVVSFQEWYYYDKVSLISNLNVFAFKAGAIFLIFALGLYVEANLRWSVGGELNSRYDRSCLIFWGVLLSIALSLYGYLEFVEFMYPTPHWRDTVGVDATRSSFWRAASRGGSNGGSNSSVSNRSCSMQNLHNQNQHHLNGVGGINGSSHNNNDFEVGARVRVKQKASRVASVSGRSGTANNRPTTAVVEGRCLKQIHVDGAAKSSETRKNHVLRKSIVDSLNLDELSLSINDDGSSASEIDIEAPSPPSTPFEENNNDADAVVVDLESPSSNHNSSTEDETTDSSLSSSRLKTKKDDSDDTNDGQQRDEPTQWVVMLNDTKEIKVFAQNELQPIHHSSSSWSHHHQKLGYQSSLEMVNIEVIKVKQQELFEAIDTDVTGRVNINEICNTLGFDLPPINAADDDNEYGYYNEDTTDSTQAWYTSISGSLLRGHRKNNTKTKRNRRHGIVTSNNRIIRQYQIKARSILREHSILQEAVLKLLERLVRRQYYFIILEQENMRKAHRYLRKVKKQAAEALHAIDNGEDDQQQIAYDNDSNDDEYCSRDAGGVNNGTDFGKHSIQRRRMSCKFPYLKTGDGISKHEWEQIMTGIFHDKFF